MARPKKHKIKFDEATLNNLMQEIYDESRNLKIKLTRLFNKWEEKVKDGGEIAGIGDQIVKVINAEAKNQDQKIMLMKYLKEIVYNEKKTGEGDEESGNGKNISLEDKNQLLQMVKEEKEKRFKEQNRNKK